ncbi:MAG TPA: hypothetical protein PK079_11395 [Leptospiraceae bacterium]|nr:hypothetical protein [Leptospiraceae bacterium]HMW05330.1 hypothetical protein [Leptospiraceae bacterium]HMX32913.1 hypothetical protein [Leptospiraceae bacterium]HMY31526.1 hypothetical protein [Leptospiraceae bacterium]HMZ67392.1 hypothetical protein [Leptospiraceae bacterium]
MKKDYLLIIGGLVPLLFSLFVLNYFLKDDRKDLFESAKLLDSKSYPNIKEGDFVKFSGILSQKNSFVKDKYVLAVKEKFVKGQNGKRSDWFREEFYFQTLFVESSGVPTFEINVANDYLPCGNEVQISDSIPKKSRVLGIISGVNVSAVGRVTSINPLRLDTGHSLCTGSIEDYDSYLRKKNLGYLFILICIALPSLGLIYFGFFKERKIKPE